MEIGSNRLTEIENLDKLLNLRELVLAKNKIKQIENLNFLKNLKTLNLSVKSA